MRMDLTLRDDDRPLVAEIPAQGDESDGQLLAIHFRSTLCQSIHCFIAGPIVNHNEFPAIGSGACKPANEGFHI